MADEIQPILMGGQAATGAGTAYRAYPTPSLRTFQATVSGTGAVAATVVIEVSNDTVGWLTLGTITPSGTTSASDGFASNAPWLYIRANLTAISGTDAAVTVTMGA